MKRFLAVLAIAFLCLWPMVFILPASANAQCIPIAVFQEQLKHTDWKSILLEGAQIEKAAEIFNALPPESENVIASAILIERPDGGGFLAVGPDGAYCGLVQFDAQQYRALVKFVVGVES